MLIPRASARLLLLALAACGGGSPSEKPQPPATIAHPVNESDLTSISLTPEAEHRIGIVTAVVERRRVPRTRSVGGDLMVRPGNLAVLVAPRAGTVRGAGPGGFPVAGSRVRAGTPVAQLLPLPAESDLFGAPEDVAAAQARVENARLRAERAEELLRQRAGTIEAVEDARATLAEAEAALRAAQARVSVSLGGDSGSVAPMTLSAPFDGVVQDLAVAAGQRVASGTRLLDIAATDPLWVKVPLFAGDVSGVDAARGITVRGVSDARSSLGRFARAIRGPQSADPLAASVDLYFELANTDGALRPGERVAVMLSLKGGSEGLVVPWSAVVRDLHGGSWVYQRVAEGRYVRQRVEVAYVTGDDAVLARGPAPGAVVVQTGAAELFSTEFGPAK